MSSPRRPRRRSPFPDRARRYRPAYGRSSSRVGSRLESTHGLPNHSNRPLDDTYWNANTIPIAPGRSRLSNHTPNPFLQPPTSRSILPTHTHSPAPARLQSTHDLPVRSNRSLNDTFSNANYASIAPGRPLFSNRTPQTFVQPPALTPTIPSLTPKPPSPAVSLASLLEHIRSFWTEAEEAIMERTARNYDLVLAYERDSNGGERWLTDDIAKIRFAGRNFHKDRNALNRLLHTILEVGGHSLAAVALLKTKKDAVMKYGEQLESSIRWLEHKPVHIMLNTGEMEQDLDGIPYSVKPYEQESILPFGPVMRWSWAVETLQTQQHGLDHEDEITADRFSEDTSHELGAVGIPAPIGLTPNTAHGLVEPIGEEANTSLLTAVDGSFEEDEVVDEGVRISPRTSPRARSRIPRRARSAASWASASGPPYGRRFQPERQCTLEQRQNRYVS